MYTIEQKKEIQEIIQVFRDYLRNSQYVDVVWSDKHGYVLLQYNPGRQDFVTVPRIITDGAELFRLLLEEIAYDVLDRKNGNYDHVTEKEKEQIREALMPYLQELPQYKIQI